MGSIFVGEVAQFTEELVRSTRPYAGRTSDHEVTCHTVHLRADNRWALVDVIGPVDGARPEAIIENV